MGSDCCDEAPLAFSNWLAFGIAAVAMLIDSTRKTYVAGFAIVNLPQERGLGQKFGSVIPTSSMDLSSHSVISQSSLVPD
jgi:hypothetical protein